MPVHRRSRRTSAALPLSAAAWLLAGAAAGLVAGVALADRSNLGRALGRRLARLARIVESLGSPTGSDTEADPDAADQEYDALGDDDAGDADATGDDDGSQSGLDARVLSAFEQDPVLSQRAIEISETAPGAILLRGRVPNERDVRHAVTIARGTPGVERVEHHLRVRRPRAEGSGSEARV